jgi:hypothetical protein
VADRDTSQSGPEMSAHIIGCYSLDLYCCRKNPAHKHSEFPHNYTAETGGECRKDARKDGWKLNLRDQTAVCPKCSCRTPPTGSHR